MEIPPCTQTHRHPRPPLPTRLPRVPTAVGTRWMQPTPAGPPRLTRSPPHPSPGCGPAAGELRRHRSAQPPPRPPLSIGGWGWVRVGDVLQPPFPLESGELGVLAQSGTRLSGSGSVVRVARTRRSGGKGRRGWNHSQAACGAGGVLSSLFWLRCVVFQGIWDNSWGGLFVPVGNTSLYGLQAAVGGSGTKRASNVKVAGPLPLFMLLLMTGLTQPWPQPCSVALILT